MSKTVYDLAQAVKRHLTSNTQLVSLVQGDAENGQALEVQIDAAILEAANNARRYAERLHDFAVNDMTGRVLITNGCPIDLGHVAVKRFYSGVDSLLDIPIVRIDSGEDEWPELVVSRAVETAGSSYIDITGTLNDISGPVVFPRLFPGGTFFGIPFWTNDGGPLLDADYYVNGSETNWFISKKTGLGVTASWISEGGEASPDEVTNWTPQAHATGDPTLTMVTENASVAQLDFSNVVSVKFTGNGVSSPLVEGTEYTVFGYREDGNNAVLQLGISPGTEIAYENVLATFTTAEVRKFKTITQVYQYDQATRSILQIPTKLRRTEVLRDRRIRNLGNQEPYPGDLNAQGLQELMALVYSDEIVIQPAQVSYTVAIDGNVWSKDYVSLSDTDWFLERGFDFMMWQTIVEVNHMLLKFVARQEGTLSPPTQARDMALESLIMLDSTHVDSHIYHDL